MRPLGAMPAARAAAAALLMALAGCASPPPAPVEPGSPAPPPPAAAPAERPTGVDHGPGPEAGGEVLARNERLLIYRPATGDTLDGIAARFLGGTGQGWQIADANDVEMPRAGQPLLVPLQPLNPLGVSADRVQLVPILCYHRLGSGSSKMIVSPASFEAQMAWLVRNGYRVVKLSELSGFLAGQQPLPQRAVVVTFDDGYESFYRQAFPVLKKYRLPATVFVYTDFLGGGDALTWSQMQEMLASGLVDVQSHSKSHRNLVERLPGESEERYRANLDAEMRVPRELLERRLPSLKVRHLAYPFGDADETVIASAARHGFELAATVVPGGNAFFAAPLMLRRTMIFGDTSLDAFKARLQVSRPVAEP